MKLMLAATALALCAFTPGVASACEYDDTSAAATAPTQVGVAPAPAASKVPAQNVVKASTTKAKQTASKTKTVPDAKVAAVSTR